MYRETAILREYRISAIRLPVYVLFALSFSYLLRIDWEQHIFDVDAKQRSRFLGKLFCVLTK